MNNNSNYEISASILAADFARLGEDTAKMITAGADMVHVDVMDNHYVPNLTMGPMVCSALRDYGITAPLDVHLMINPVDRIIPDFAKAGANIITFHPETSLHIHRTLQLIHDNGCKAGLVFNPSTPLHYLDHVMSDIDMILIMSVNPGFGGQKFISQALTKIHDTKQRIMDSGFNHIRLEVDGGVNSENIIDVAKAGANTFVMGSALFHSKDYHATIANIREKLASINL